MHKRINHLDTLAQRQQERTAFWLLHEIHHALQAAFAPAAPAESVVLTVPAAPELPPDWRGWWDLIRFCLGHQSVADWLRHEREALQRIQALAALAQQDALADILSQALQGHAQPAAVVTFSQLGAEDLRLVAGAPPQEHFQGQDWSGTDTAIQLHSEGLAHTIAALLLAERDRLFLPPPPADCAGPLAVAGPAAADHEVAAAATAAAPSSLSQTLPQPLSRIVGRRQLAVRPLAPASGQGLLQLPVQHHCGAALEADWLEFYRLLWGEPLAPLLDAWAEGNGARLFCHGASIGLTLHPIEHWPTAQAQMLDWAQTRTWPDAPAALPDWLRSAVCFAQGGMDHEHWLLVTQGELAGCVLLSETDALLGRPRFASVAQFFEALAHRPAAVLGASGHLRYAVDGVAYEVAEAMERLV
ncbi:hypothetical protein EII18_00665 [Comamonadaceae bacterium OH3737_COT-264]|nr:hypothetical protein EII18_00665 [Comamonadaceae bacterium OH3737_COT-264]